MPNDVVLLTGATGYVGGRLLRALARAGRPLRCLVRDRRRLDGRLLEGVDVVEGDVLAPETLPAALDGVGAAYYLIHSMGGAGDFRDQDRRAAEHFAAAARAAGVGRIVYLGGLGDEDEALSAHLASRHEVGRALRASGAQVLELRASIVIGSGSLSYEMVRALVERLPVMVTPRWVDVPAQPIAIEDLLAYLVQALSLPLDGNRVYEIGGAEVVSYGGLMRAYARRRGLRRWTVRVPVLSPRLSSLWLGLVTPVYARVGRKLIDSVRHPTVVRDPAALAAFDVRPMGVDRAIERALSNEDAEFAQTRWSDALSSARPARSWAGMRLGGRIVDSRTRAANCSPERAFAAVARIGGQTGWYFGDALWRLRGFVDLLVGGAGLRRGRRDPEQLSVGETVDFWRVEAVEPGRRLRLRAEMVLPGRAWLEFEVSARDGGGARVRQTAVFDPHGLGGLAYWYALYPLHQLVFAGMLRGLVRAAERAGG